MKRGQKLTWIFSFIVCFALAGEAPSKLERVVVNERPFGDLGVNAVCHVGWWAMFNKDAKIRDMVIIEVESGSVAEKCGFRIKDEVVKLQGFSIGDLSVRQVAQIWHEQEAGKLVRFEVRRAGQKTLKIIEVPVAKRKPNQAPATPTSVTPPVAQETRQP